MSGSGSEPVGGDGAGPVHPQAQAKPKAKGRGKAAARPKLDLDKEIQEANMLATMSRKLMKAARSIERNNKKSRSRLIRKAGKLSPEDLERLAVLKRCGLYGEGGASVPEDGQASSGSDGNAAGTSSSSSRLEPKKQKLAALLEGNPSAQAFLDGVRGAFPSLTKAGTGRPVNDDEGGDTGEVELASAGADVQSESGANTD